MKGARLLLAEDDIALAALLEEYLSESGYEVTICYRGDDALTALRQEHFDIVLTDIVMPGADGLSVLAEASVGASKTLVILMTGYSGIEDALHAVEQGAYDFVSKPFQLPEILVRIDNAARYQALLRRWELLSDEHPSALTSHAFMPFDLHQRIKHNSESAAIRAYGAGKG